MPAIPHASTSSPRRTAYARIEASTARACLRRLSPFVNSVRMSQAPARDGLDVVASRVCVEAVERLAQRLHLALERADPVEQVLHRTAHRVGQVGLVEVDAVGDALA